MKALFLLLCVLVNFANALSSNCSNPVFVNPARYGYKQIPGMSRLPSFAQNRKPESWPVSKNEVCSYLAQNQDKSCCSTETLQDIEKIVGQAKSFVQNQRWAMQNASLTFFEKTFVHRFNGILYIICLGDDKCLKEMKQAITDYESSLSENFDKLTRYSTQCTTQLLNYFEGMLCFACDAKWPQFIRKNKIVIANKTCTGIVSSCKPLFDQMNVFNALSVAFTNKVIAAFEASDFPGGGHDIFKHIFKIDWPDACGGSVDYPADCTEFSCDTILSGVGLPYNAINRWTPWNHLSPDRMLSALAEFADGETVNIYAKDGYDALHVGCISNNNCDGADYPDNSPDPAPISPAVTAVIVVVVILVVAAAAGFFLWTQLKQSLDTSVSTQEPEENYGSTIM